MQDQEEYPYEAEVSFLHNLLKSMQELGPHPLKLTEREIECLINAIEVAYSY